MVNKLLVATHNQGKVVEFSEMMADLSLEWLSLESAGVKIDVEETGSSFQENAMLKASAYARESGMLTLADDSGLEVDALGGQPGIYTARYGGPELSHTQRYQFLLRNISHVPWDQRTARFRCVIAMAAPDGTILGSSEGICPGMIAREPAGSGGFGYDPIFFLEDRNVTMAQVDSAVKHQISHRGLAMKKIEPLLRQVLAG